MKTTIRHHIASRSARALALGAAVLAGSQLAHAAQAPSPAEMEHCLQQAGLELKLGGREMRLTSGQKFALGSERHMIALNTEVALGTATMNPRLYCTVESDGRISMLQSLPRLPFHPATELVAK